MADTLKPRRVGMFGGAFDPPHWAHRSLAQTGLEQLQLDHLHILPTGHAWHKARTLLPAEHRIAMCERAFGDLPRVHIDARETERTGPSYTADTLGELRAEHPQADPAGRTFHQGRHPLRLDRLDLRRQSRRSSVTSFTKRSRL